MSGVPHKKMVQRMMIIASLMVGIGFIGLIVRLGYLQLLDPEDYKEQAINQQISIKPLSAQRGSIFDRNNKVLAQSATVWQVSVFPGQIETDEQRSNIANTLASILDLDPVSVYDKVANKESKYASHTIKKQVEKDQVEEISKFISENKYGPYIAIDEDFKRYYPYGDLAASVIGFTGSDHQGLYGLESQYEEVLSGTSGKVISMTTAKGQDMPFPYKTTTDPINGNSLVLTIDQQIQSIVENHLETAIIENNIKNKACAIVMNVRTGEIYAMSTRPEFDPNEPFEIYDEEIANKIQELVGDERSQELQKARENQWRNKTITEMYEPGSVFKIITAASALDAGAVSMNSNFYCSGSTKVAKVPIGCWRSAGHGSQDLTHAMMNSCNPAFIDIGTRLGTTKFVQYFTAFGFTEKTGIDLPAETVGEAGVTYHTEQQMGPVELAVDSFGQTFKVTPIQLITAVSSAVNGGNLVTPHVVKNVVDSDGNIVETYDTTAKRQVISEETSKNICTMIEQVVSGGSGKNAYVSGYRIGGKTGTSEKTETRGGEKIEVISSFLGVAPSDNPQIAILVLLDEPNVYNSYGSTIAAPVVGKMMSDILPIVGVEPKYTADEIKNADVVVRNLVGYNTLDSEGLLRNDGLTAKIIGGPGVVVKQVPSNGNLLNKGGTVILYTEGATDGTKSTTVPNLIGKTPSEANYLITQAGLNMRVTRGYLEQEGATVSNQSISPDTVVDTGTIIQIEFTSTDTRD